MPYALSGLSTAIGTAGVPQLGIKATGMMGSENLFIRSIGNIGNAIRTGYSQATMKVGKAFNSITNSIKKGFSNLGTGNNIFLEYQMEQKDYLINLKQLLKNILLNLLKEHKVQFKFLIWDMGLEKQHL